MIIKFWSVPSVGLLFYGVTLCQLFSLLLASARDWTIGLVQCECCYCTAPYLSTHHAEANLAVILLKLYIFRLLVLLASASDWFRPSTVRVLLLYSSVFLSQTWRSKPWWIKLAVHQQGTFPDQNLDFDNNQFNLDNLDTKLSTQSTTSGTQSTRDKLGTPSHPPPLTFLSWSWLLPATFYCC